MDSVADIGLRRENALLSPAQIWGSAALAVCMYVILKDVKMTAVIVAAQLASQVAVTAVLGK